MYNPPDDLKIPRGRKHKNRFKVQVKAIQKQEEKLANKQKEVDKLKDIGIVTTIDILGREYLKSR